MCDACTVTSRGSNAGARKECGLTHRKDWAVLDLTVRNCEDLTTTGRERPRSRGFSPQTLRSGVRRISMSRVETVEDPEDPRLIDYRELRDADRRRRSGTFIAEGREVVRRLLRTRRYEIRSALVTPPALAALGAALAAGGVRTDPRVKAIVGIEFHHGCLVVGERGKEALPDAILAEAEGKSLVVLEDLGDASNVGAMFRNGLAFGVGAVFLSPGTADPLYRKSIRVLA